MSHANSALTDWRLAEAGRDWRYPLSRWYLRPLACRLAAALDATRVRPWMLTLSGFACVAAAGALLAALPAAGLAAGLLVMLGWLCDRADGALARRQARDSAWGAWLDANLDELGDVLIHAAIAWAWSAAGTGAPLLWLSAYVSGKYLFMYGLQQEEHLASPVAPAATHASCRTAEPASRGRAWLAACYHGPANADLRVHALAASLVLGWSGVWLALSALYYHARWIVRYVLVARRLSQAERTP